MFWHLLSSSENGHYTGKGYTSSTWPCFLLHSHSSISIPHIKKKRLVVCNGQYMFCSFCLHKKSVFVSDCAVRQLSVSGGGFIRILKYNSHYCYKADPIHVKLRARPLIISQPAQQNVTNELA